MKWIRIILDFLLATYLFIATASACLVSVTYILAGQKLQLSAITFAVFFSTLFIYNFHKVSTLLVRISFSPAIVLKQFESISSLTKTMILISITGLAASSLFL